MRVERAKGAILDACWKHCLILGQRQLPLRQPPLCQPPLGCQPVDRMRRLVRPKLHPPPTSLERRGFSGAISEIAPCAAAADFS
jgi:hypothetical protein